MTANRVDTASGFLAALHRRAMRSRAAWLCLLALACLVLPGCGDGGPETQVDLNKRAPVEIKNRADELTYAYLPQYSPQVSFLRHHLLVERLASDLGRPVRQVFPVSFDDHQTLFGQGRIDISYSNPFVYIRMARQEGAKAFARILEPGGNGLAGQIICRADNTAIRDIGDCRGKRWIATDPTSAGGYLYPLGLFYDKGLHKKDFASIAFAGGNQERVVFAVFSGEYDIGTVRKGTLDVVADKIPRSAIRVVAESREYPSWVYAARKGLPPDLTARAQDSLTSINPDDPADARIPREAHIGRIVPASDDDFAPVRELMRRIERDGEEGE